MKKIFPSLSSLLTGRQAEGRGEGCGAWKIRGRMIEAKSCCGDERRG